MIPLKEENSGANKSSLKFVLTRVLVNLGSDFAQLEIAMAAKSKLTRTKKRRLQMRRLTKRLEKDQAALKSYGFIKINP